MQSTVKGSSNRTLPRFKEPALNPFFLLEYKTEFVCLLCRAFSAEIAGVRDSVSDTTIGHMRMQFWKVPTILKTQIFFVHQKS